MKLEVVLLGVSDVDGAKGFYENLSWRLDIDVAAGDFRGVQMTPHNSEGFPAASGNSSRLQQEVHR